MKNGFATNWRSLIRDLVILVIGIMLSLILNECRQNACASEDERRIMQQLAADIATDTTALKQVIADVDEMMGLYSPLFYNNELEDYERYGIASSAIFVPFLPQRTAMLEMSYSNRSGDIKRRDMVAKAMALHDTHYGELIKIADLIGEYVIKEQIPFLSDNLFHSFDTTFAEEELKKLNAFIKSDQFRQRIYWIEVLFENQRNSALNALKEARDLLNELNTVYNWE